MSLVLALLIAGPVVAFSATVMLWPTYALCSRINAVHNKE